jgi:hypothetical protein
VWAVRPFLTASAVEAVLLEENVPTRPDVDEKKSKLKTNRAKVK